MKIPTMSLDEAWRTLGRDPIRIIATINSSPTSLGKVLNAEKTLEWAKKYSKRLLAQSHPDKNQSDPNATQTFIRIQNAIESIEFHTIEFRRSHESVKKRAPKSGMIEIKDNDDKDLEFLISIINSEDL